MKLIIILIVFCLVACKYGSEERIFNKELSAVLDSVNYRDQHFRGQLDSVIEKYGAESNEMDNLGILISQNDVKNQRVVSKILDTEGWLTPELVGEERSNALFYVIQHAPYSMQKKYLPLIQNAVKNGDAKSEHLAMLEDRIAVKDGAMQKYGTQVSLNPQTGEQLLFNVFEPEKLNERRKSMGLQPIEEYLKGYNFVWDVKDNDRKNVAYRDYLEKLK